MNWTRNVPLPFLVSASLTGIVVLPTEDAAAGMEEAEQCSLDGSELRSELGTSEGADDGNVMPTADAAAGMALVDPDPLAVVGPDSFQIKRVLMKGAKI